MPLHDATITLKGPGGGRFIQYSSGTVPVMRLPLRYMASARVENKNKRERERERERERI